MEYLCHDGENWFSVLCSRTLAIILHEGTGMAVVRRGLVGKDGCGAGKILPFTFKLLKNEKDMHTMEMYNADEVVVAVNGIV